MSKQAVEGFVTTEEAAAFLGKPPSWLYNNAEKLDVPRFRVGTQLRYRYSELAEWVEGGRLSGVAR